MFRPCIDLHEGKVKQIVGGTLGSDPAGLQTNFVSSRGAAYFADLYRQDGLWGGHVVLLGPGNETEAKAALEAHPGGLQIGGGVNVDNACEWLEAGASHVIVTSWLFRDRDLDWNRLQQITRLIGKARLVIDLSCRKQGTEYVVVTNKFQTFTNTRLDSGLFRELSSSCGEFLVHAVDVEGLCQGIDEALVAQLAKWSPLPVTYAGGAHSLADLERVEQLGVGKVDLTIGSALDIFGGSGVRYADAVAFNRQTAR